MTELYPLGLKINHLITVNFCDIYFWLFSKETNMQFVEKTAEHANQKEEYAGHPAEYFYELAENADLEAKYMLIS